MQPSPATPKLHVLVCCNRREAGAPLGEGCGERGDAVYAALKDEVARRGDVASTWVTRTFCLGICPKRGATVAVHGGARPIYSTEVEPSDAAVLLEGTVTANARTPARNAGE